MSYKLVYSTASMSEVFLWDLSERDRKFDIHKQNAMRLANLLDEKLPGHALRIRKCATNLSFALLETGELKLRQRYEVIRGKNVPVIKFCCCRGCCVCQWRRSGQWYCRAFRAIPKILEDYPATEYSFLLATFTVKNPPLDKLLETVKAMNEAWRQMSRPYQKVGNNGSQGNPKWKAVGFTRSLEVTAGDVPGHCHPHFHCLLLMPNSYFSSDDYMETEEWAYMWAHYLKLDYKPVVDVRAVKGNLRKGFVETFKYTAKEQDLLTSPDFAYSYITQMHGVRCIDIGGCLRSYLRSKEPENLIHDEEEESLIPSEQAQQWFEFQWSEHDMSDLIPNLVVGIYDLKT